MKLNCELVRDLLPLYAEDLLQECNRKLVAEHLADCAGCRDALVELTAPEMAMEHSADGLKGLKKRLRRHTMTVSAITAFVVVFLALLVWSCFISGSDAMGYALLAFYVILPLASFVCSLLVGLKEHWVKWLVPLIFAVVATVLPQIVFGYTESTFFSFEFVPGLIGAGIGHMIHCRRNRKIKSAS